MIEDQEMISHAPEDVTIRLFSRLTVRSHRDGGPASL